MALFLQRRMWQYIATLSAALGFLSIGALHGWSSPALPKLEAKDSPVQISRDQGSWIVAVRGLPGILAPLFGYLVNKFGRKFLLLGAAIPIFISYMLIVFASSATEIIISSFISGIGITIFYIGCPMYIGEIAEEEIRGILGSLMDIMMNFGSLLSYSLGPYVSVKTFSGCSALIPLIFFLLMFFMPESPYYLITRNKRLEAEECLIKLRGGKREDVQEELQRLSTSVLEQISNKGKLQDLVSTKASRRALIIMLVLIIAQHFSGMTALTNYMQQIFDQTPQIKLSSSESTMVVGAIKLIAGAIFTLSFIDRIGRRPLLLISALGCAITLTTLGAYQYVYINIDTNDMVSRWVPITCLVLFTVFYSVGLGPVPVLIMGELFSMNVKDLAVSIGVLTTSVCFMAVTKIYDVVAGNLGQYSAFWMFAICCSCTVLFVILCVPETRGKPFDLIIAQLDSDFQQPHQTSILRRPSDRY